MRLTLRQMQVFDAVAGTGTIAGAATRLNMSQSATSSALTDLQIILRRRLFAHAKGRALQITDEGKRLRPIIRSLLEEIQDIERSEIEAPLCGTLIIGATTMIAETDLPRLCVAFTRQHPDVRIHVEAVSVGELFDRLVRFEMPTALIEIVPDVEGIELTKWRMDELLLVTHPDNPLARRSGLRIADLAGADWCLREAYSTTTSRLRYMLYKDVGELRVVFESTSNWAVRHAVIAGGGIGCLSRTLVEPDIESGRLARLDVQDFSFSRVLNLARPKGIFRSRLVQAFDRFIIDHGDSFEADSA